MKVRETFCYGDIEIEAVHRSCDGEEYHLTTDFGGTEWLFTICTLDGVRCMQVYIRNVNIGPIEYTPWWQPLDTLIMDPAICNLHNAADFAAWMLDGCSSERALYNVTMQLDAPIL